MQFPKKIISNITKVFFINSCCEVDNNLVCGVEEIFISNILMNKINLNFYFLNKYVILDVYFSMTNKLVVVIF